MHHLLPPLWLVSPFLCFLLLIAAGPLFAPKLWHKYYKKIAFIVALLVMGYYIFALGNRAKPIEAVAEYIQFIILIGSLYVTTGGILIKIQMQVSPWINSVLLATAAIFANVIGTTGASMLFIRPYLRLNRNHIKTYHIIFFIFIVSNIGGALTPIGDPPLFLGFLKGIPFVWPLVHNIGPWLLAIFLLLLVFYFLDSKNGDNSSKRADAQAPVGQPKLVIQGKLNLLWLALIIASVFLDPTIFPWVPSIHYHGHTISYVRELVMLTIAGCAFFSTDQSILSHNDFSLEPLLEVAVIFIGIFGSMIPALEWIGAFAQSDLGKGLITPTNLYWTTGFLSSFLDNAPTYLNFVAASMASQGVDITSLDQVKAYAAGNYPCSVMNLQAIAVAAVFFGAMSYIGNGPNFMVKAIAEQHGVKMPSFSNYLLKFSIPVLLPVLFIVWRVFFYGGV